MDFVWTTEKPTELGLYLISPPLSASTLPFGVADVRLSALRPWAGKLIVVTFDFVGALDDLDGDYQWAGPIAAPKEQP